MPQPSSTMRTSSWPPCSASISMRVLPASTLFSSNSLTTLLGRSMTSPAAIWFMTAVGRAVMRGVMRTVLLRARGRSR